MAALQSVHELVERDALKAAQAVFAYDSTPSAPFGQTLAAAREQGDARVYPMQVRAGAGASLVGFVEAAAFTSKGADQSSKPVAVLGSTASFLALVPSLLALPEPTKRAALNIHVSAQTSSLAVDESGEPTLTQVPDLGAVLEGAKQLQEGGWNGAVVLSETAEEAAHVATGVAKGVAAAGFDLVAVFDGLTAGRQLAPLAASPAIAAGKSLEATLSSAFPYFSYTGSASASKVLVLPASTYSAAAKAAIAAASVSDVGVLSVRVLAPWDAEALLKAVPQSAKSLHVFTEEGEASGPLFDEVLSSVLSAGSSLKVRALPVPTSSVPTVQDWAARIAKLAGAAAPASLVALLPSQAKLAVFWDVDASSGKTETVPATLARTFAGANTGVSAKLEVKYDNFRQAGLQQAALLLENAGQAAQDVTLSSIVETSAPSLLFVGAPQNVFKAYAPFSPSTVSKDTRIVVAGNWTQDDFAKKLPYAQRKALVELADGGKGHVFAIDADKVAKAQGVSAAAVAEIVFWTLYLPATISAKELVTLLAQTPTFADWQASKLVEVNGAVRNALTKIEVLASWADEPVDEEGNKVEQPAPLPTQLVATAAAPNPDRTFSDPVASIAGDDQKKAWHHAAHRFLFPEAFALEGAFEEKLRPDLPERNFLITVTENRRLTPNTYDRNVFHIEFSTEGTGLKYAIGEALGIHGWNDADEVASFLEWYGLDPEAVISVPSRVDPARVEQRTVFQVFQQNLDIFGKPGKSFYETLSRYASNKNEERALRFIACPDGHSTFKKLSEMDTVTYADIMRQFPSARPPVEDLVREIEEIKPRHYSIASSQNFVGDSVHLLIVTVEWQTPKGSPRYGQCTRYLAGLKPGDKVMASVKPSVMKLPPLDTQPVVMAGLGTGAAPFRAFIQERAFQRAQGKEVGPLIYYFGSRHRAQEYLYGEELEAYFQEGVVTHMGLAFSRDSDKKVYIQHKMNEDAELLAKMLDDGAFYLCGPTWPVPDVYEALITAFTGAGKTVDEAAEYIEWLKEEERFVLEVY
ncbi:sulfite reductase [NADPH] flavoprotein component [Rhodotorula kratochvilovae]